MMKPLTKLQTFNLKLLVLIIVGPCLVLILTGLVGRQMGMAAMKEQAMAAADLQTDVIISEFDNLFEQATVLTRFIAERQKVIGDRPDPDTMRFLAELLKETPEEEIAAVYMAFEGKDYRDKDAIQWVD